MIGSTMASGALSMLLHGYGHTASTNKALCMNPPVVVRAAIRCGTTAALSTNMNLFAVQAYNGQAQFGVDQEGDYYYNGSGAAFDEYCDIGLVRAFSTTMADANCQTCTVIRTKWDDHVKENEETLVQLGVLGYYVNCVPADKRGMVNGSQLQRLHNGAIWQLYTKISDQGEEIKALQTQLTALQGGK